MDLLSIGLLLGSRWAYLELGWEDIGLGSS